MIQFSALQTLCEGRIVQQYEDQPITALAIDSRKTVGQRGVIFFAIDGVRHDGHAFIDSLYRAGVRQFVVEKNVDVTPYPEANIFLATTSVLALQQLASYHRHAFTIPIIGITGSNGKTIIKEWLHQVLSVDQTVAKNPGSYNSQVGVPLSVWQLQSHHTMGVFEAGISKPEEMINLQPVIDPTIGIFTNIGSAHDHGFVNTEQKIREKLILFKNSRCVIYCKDHKAIDTIISTTDLPTLSWGTHPDAQIPIRYQAKSISIAFQSATLVLDIPFLDPASIENVIHVIVTLLYLGYNAHEIQQRIHALHAVPMRLELKAGVQHCQVIDDTYNNDLGGLEISLQFLAHQHQRKKKSLILSDVLESGLSSEILAKHIAERVNQHHLHRFIGIGKTLSDHQDVFASNSIFYPNTEAFLQSFPFETLQDEIILVKGARAFQFERIVHRLQQKVHGTVMEINLDNLTHNLNYFRSKLQPSTKIMVMVKAFAYGSGSNEIANLLEYHRVDYLGVAYADEGIDLRKNNISLPIMVMNPSIESFDALLQYNLEPEIYNFRIAHALIDFLHGAPCTIHVKLDTGMHRLGFEENEVPALITLLQQHPNIQVASIFTHIVGADESQHDEFSNQQAACFKRGADAITQAIGYKPLYHVLNSPGILRLPTFQFDMVRLGIGLYGINPTEDVVEGLKPVATLKTIISQIKRIPKGETIGYGRRGVASQDTTIATIAIGYADGFSRAFSRGVGKVLIHGQRAPVMGNVCMDMTMIDITGINANEGDEVIIFGEALPIVDVAETIQTIPYEILTNTSERVKRVFVAEGM
jgi:alanine racemase